MLNILFISERLKNSLEMLNLKKKINDLNVKIKNSEPRSMKRKAESEDEEPERSDKKQARLTHGVLERGGGDHDHKNPLREPHVEAEHLLAPQAHVHEPVHPNLE